MAPRTRSELRRGRLAVAVPVIAATLALLVPIALWTRFGDGDPLRSLQVAIAAAFIAWAIARRAEDGDVAAARPTPPPTPHRGTARPHYRPHGTARLARDVGCCAPAHKQLERRPARRRSRP